MLCYRDRSQNSSVGIAINYRLEAAVRFSESLRSLSTACRPALRPTQPPIQWVPRVISPEVKRSGREVGRPHPSSGEFKNDGAIPPVLHTSSCCGPELITHRDNYLTPEING
jgi:hypothetical protein